MFLLVLLVGAASLRFAREPLLRACARHEAVARRAALLRHHLEELAGHIVLHESPPDPTQLARDHYGRSRSALESAA